MDKYRFRQVREEYNKRNKARGIGVTQEDMARICSVSKSTISRIEKGETEPTLQILIRYADTFGATTDYLLRHTDAKNPENRTVSHELGLSDEAIETLKYIKKYAAFQDYDILAFISAFLGSGTATFSFFEGLFNMMSAEYGFSRYNFEPQSIKMKYLFELEQKMANRTMEYIKFDVMPQLEKVIKDCNEALEQSELYTGNQEEAEAGK